MSKTIAIIRHAKSSWADVGITDYERPLNERGKNDAPIMGRRIKEAGYVPNVILTSTAKRAHATAKQIAKAMELPADVIIGYDELYHCDVSIFSKLIQALDNQHEIVFIVAHNPSITEYANTLSEDFYIDNLPTCGVVIATAQVADWQAYHQAEKKVVHFDYPKNI